MASYHVRIFTLSHGFGGAHHPEYAMVQGETTLDEWLDAEDDQQFILESMATAGERGELVRVMTKKRGAWAGA